MKKHHKIEVGGEIVYLRKDFLGWHVIYPNRINNKIVWKNLIAGGSWIKLGITIALVILILGCVSEYSTALRVANDCLTSGITLIP